MKRPLRKMVFVEPKSTHLHIYSRVCIPRLGSVLLGTIMRAKGFDVRVYIEDIQAIDMAELHSADLVAVSAITSTAPQSYKLADMMRAAGKVVVMGGTHTSFMPASTSSTRSGTPLAGFSSWGSAIASTPDAV